MSVALITGASTGIGAATAVELARRGYAVGVVARRRDLLEAVASRARAAGARAEVAVADAAERGAVEAAVDTVRTALGPIDVLVNNAGMPGGGPLADLDVERIERVMRVNFLGAVYATKAVLGDMLARGRGTIVDVASIAGRTGVPGAGPYAASKFALAGFSEALALELAPRGVRVVLVNPGPVRTEGFPHERLRDRWVLPPETVGRRIARAIARGTPEVTLPRYYRLVPVLAVLAPPLYRAALARFARS